MLRGLRILHNPKPGEGGSLAHIDCPTHLVDNTIVVANVV